MRTLGSGLYVVANNCDKLWRSILDFLVRFLEDSGEFWGKTCLIAYLVPYIYVRDRWDKGLKLIRIQDKEISYPNYQFSFFLLESRADAF